MFKSNNYSIQSKLIPVIRFVFQNGFCNFQISVARFTDLSIKILSETVRKAGSHDGILGEFKTGGHRFKTGNLIYVCTHTICNCILKF